MAEDWVSGFKKWKEEKDNSSSAFTNSSDYATGYKAWKQNKTNNPFSDLNQDLIKSVGNDFREGWTYNLFDPEDMQRKQQGIMPKAVESKYDLDDPVQRYLYEQVLPKDFSEKYQKAETEAQKETAENEAYNNLYRRFQNELYNEMYKAQQAEYNAAATEGRNPKQITDWEGLIASVLGKEGYADVAANFYTPKEMETATDYESLADLTSARKSAAKAKENERSFTVEDLIKGYKAADAAARSSVDAEMNSMAPLSFTTEGNVLAQQQDKRKAAREYNIEAARAELDFLEKQRERIDARDRQNVVAHGEYAESPEGQELDQRIKALKREISNMGFAKERYEILSKYEDVTNAADFDQLAAKGAAMDGSRAHRYINDIGKTRKRIEGDFWDNGVTDFFYEKYDHMTQEEVKVYNATFAKDGEKAAKEYLKALEPILNERTTNARNQMLEEATEKYPVAANIASVPMAFGKGAGYLYGAVQGIAGEYVDPNSPWMAASSAQGTIRDTTSKDMSPVGQFLYQTGMSLADFAAMAPMGQASLFFMGSGAAADTTRNAMERGATQEEALALGALSGAAEAVFEKMPLDELANIIAGGGGRSAIATILKQSGVEATEEMLTEISNKLADAVIMGDLSQYNVLVQEYMAQGMTEDEARKKASWQAVVDVGLAGLGGALSGGVTGGGAYGLSQVFNSQQRQATNALRSDLQAIGLEDKVTSRVISAYNALSDGRIKGAQKTINKLQDTVQKALNVKAETEAELNVARVEATAKLTPLYNAMQSAIQARDTAAFDKAKQDYLAAYGIQQAKTDAAKVKAENKTQEAARSIENAAAEIEETVQADQAQRMQQVLQEQLQNTQQLPENEQEKPVGLIRNFEQQLRPEQESQMRVLDAIGKKYGVSVVVEDTIDIDQGDGTKIRNAANGYFDPSTGEIHIALDGTAEAYTFVAVHELVHYLKSFNDGGYQILQDTVFEALEQNDPGMVAELIRYQMDKFGYDEEAARDEVLANTVPVILQDETFVRELVRQDRTLAERIVEFLQDFLNTLKTIYEQLIAESSWTQMELLRQDMETVGLIADLFDAALEDAVLAKTDGTSATIKFSAKDAGMSEERLAEYDKYVMRALENDRGIAEDFYLGGADERLISDAKRKGADIRGYKHRVRANDIRHVRNSHGIQKDGAYGITTGDIQAIPYILKNYTDISVRFRNGKLYGIVYVVDHVDSTYYVEGVASENGEMLECKQMVKAPLGEVPQMYHQDFGKKRSTPEYLDKASNDNLPNDVPETYVQDVHQSRASDKRIAELEEKNNKKFSLKDTSPADIDRLREENQALREANELLREQFKLTKGRKVSRKAVDKLSGEILKAYQSKYDRETLTDNLISFYDAVHKASNDPAKQEEVDAAGVALAKAILEQSTELDDTLYQEYEPLRRMLRETGISLTDTQKQEVEYRYDSYENFRRKNFGRINLKKDGISLDAFWPELAANFPDLFEMDLAEGAQPEALVRALEVIKPTYRNPFGFDMDTAAYDLAAQIYNEYFNIPEVRTMADRYAARVKEVQKQAEERIRKAREESRREYEKRTKEIEDRYRAYRKDLTERYKQATEEQKQKLNERYKAFVDRKNAKIAERLAAKKAPKRQQQAREMFQAGVDPVAAEREGKIDHLTAKALQNLYLANGYDMGGKMSAQKMNDILENFEKATDKSAFAYGRETFLRNMEDMGATEEQGRMLVDTYATPIRSAVADMTRWQKKWAERIAKLKLNREESAMVQLVGEGRVGLKELQEGLLFENGKPMDAKRIQEAVKLFRQFYDEALDLANDALLRNGYEKIEKRENYFPHFMEEENRVEKFRKEIIEGKGFELPTEISGMTDIFRPGKRWFKNFQQRIGDNTTYDAVQGFANYLDGVGNVIFLTDSIQRVRQLENAIRKRYNISSDETDVANKHLHMNRFAAYLLEYGNQLAGKKAKVDRAIEESLGRKWFARLDWLKKRFGANAVGGNISTALSNFIPLTQALATMPKRHFARGMQAAMCRQIRNDGLWMKSDFLTSRFGKQDSLLTKPLDIAFDKAGKALNFTFEAVDRFVAETIVFGKYQEGLEKGYSEEKAMRYADEYAERTMAGRSIGSVPTLMNTKTLGIFTQFQLEVNNQMSNLLKDIPRWYKGSKRKLIAALVQLFVYSWLYNELNEKLITGRRPAFDPINIVVEAVEDFAAGKAGDAFVNMGENIMDQLPFGQLLTSGGRIPLASAIEGANPFEAIRKSLNGEKAGNAWKNAGEGLLYNFLLPAAGGQVKKIVQGSQALKRGGRYYGDKLAHPVENDAGNIISSMLFGPSATREGREFAYEERRALTKSKTEAYEKMVEGGLEKQEAYDFLYDMPTKSKAAKLGHIATFDADEDGTPDLEPEEMNLVAQILGIKASGDIPAKAKREVKNRMKTIEKDEDLTEEEKQKKIEEENLQFFLTILGN